MPANKERQYYLDFLRIFAALLVIFNHTQGYHLYLEQPRFGEIGFGLQIALSVFTKINVPLFFMLSGALLLPKEESYKDLFQKRIIRFAGVVVIFSALMYVVFDQKPPLDMDFVRALFSGEVLLSYWFLFSYLAFLFCLPFLRKIAANMSRSDFLFLVVTRILFVSVLPLYRYWSNVLGVQPIVIRSDFHIPFSRVDFLFYPLIGHYLCNRWSTESITRRHAAGCVGALIAGVGLAAITTYHQGLVSGPTQDYLLLFQSVSTMAVFVLVRYLFQNRALPRFLKKLLPQLSGLTLGVYLLDPMLSYYLYYMYNGRLSQLAYSILWCFFSFIVCSMITWLMKKLPILGKIL